MNGFESSQHLRKTTYPGSLSCETITLAHHSFNITSQVWLEQDGDDLRSLDHSHMSPCLVSRSHEDSKAYLFPGLTIMVVASSPLLASSPSV
jgi:hypothetical protein